MRIHILGICGTFMGGLAQILKESGHEISGSDAQFYPPMSDHLNAMGVDMIKGYSKDTLPKADLYVIGNALSRGNECVEFILDTKLPFKSGPEMLGDILKTKKVFAVSGTHGKTTTSYMLTHIFLDQGKDIGFLVGGISDNISGSASLGTDEIFVIEADEYDSAFFDKRSKFIHYSPSTLIINNIEFDHADIFDDLKDIKRQFHHLLKIIPSSGNIIYFNNDSNTQDVINMGYWSNLIKINDDEIKINFETEEIETIENKFSLKNLPLIGEHNFKNYICAILAAKTGGVKIEDSIDSLLKFQGVKRRLEFKGIHSGIKIYDDFAHHPSAIEASSKAIRKEFLSKKILGVIELASNTMSDGTHGDALIKSSNFFDEVIWLDHKGVIDKANEVHTVNNLDECIQKTISIIKDYDIVVIMTNKDSQKLTKPLIEYLNEK
ncbi:UDP-N-acetylmuramate:L-alanyl-gamma-D-glutamyl-meso-diaminopimelate ligase [Gammaproteobacteria bacterium]|jgi:UDP-N-acetylmuramate: L-alanyl-gamma-D-glutamyl-meso-diaminopimelate ligase|nr:UDP-N-acetylmuramate:L-alanyl-gamma-D-glutamyl-meso-diaminopimelate ligase [Gammaproteobacteria bacterium]MDA8604648.1 UDP-N-acetylmuramate:L-alanyl-gamma-D-glutamyl-meso-diaminopimelate ligase [Gammaproteobacteria bacterium]MDA8733290.1 UDP-N-acetylmuramate:L-alanyl-gamma-D-glutamyl-meso-diaminopimelate ligase [Gammaproteobacteria bacterium]MDA8816303.1 UDP-N-acetylmuramate:L-alanyl-gamma-D-glutamyl-meso-diaminopimelate ligase [Gammaproteobacteria bacterium]MDA9570688.1 UDP-N-acetylmuramate|tara:strand:+ start:1062 stop:2369 length:1308 start_codon:yes stop_codon:yes gene_type:complete